MILVTGPTGSGKTTTLYAAINEIKSDEDKIVTIEDPVEYQIRGITQIPVNEKKGLTFARGLRSILRHDPDKILVGEIRDLETAEIAIKAAQTGHMVLSTLHTNDAPTTLSRLMNMGVAPFNIASAVLLIVAQRLARRLCPVCRKPANLPKEVLLKAGYKETDLRDLKIYAPHPDGCESCSNGYKGRVGIYQVMPISEAIGEIIMRGGTALDIERQAKKDGIPDLRESALKKVRDGITSMEELERITNQ
jgi:type IV pilus assembly protein PilB